jgi:hypothetical protein
MEFCKLYWLQWTPSYIEKVFGLYHSRYLHFIDCHYAYIVDNLNLQTVDARRHDWDVFILYKCL